MKKISIAIATSLLIFAGLQNAYAKGPIVSEGASVVAQTGVIDKAQVEGVIKAIDAHAPRVVTIETLDGKTHVFKVKKGHVKNFDQLRVGDHITVSYTQSLNLQLEQGATGREKDESRSVTSAPLGEKPAGQISESTTLVSEVVDLNKTESTVTIKNVKGERVTIKVTDPKLMHSVKKGDQVVVTYTESLAMAVTEASKAKK